MSLTFIPPPLRSSPPPRWRDKVRVALSHAGDHRDADLVRRMAEMFEQQIAELERMADEAETHAMKAALQEAVSLMADAAWDSMCSPVCVLDAWDGARDGRAWGDKLDQRRMVRSA